MTAREMSALTGAQRTSREEDSSPLGFAALGRGILHLDPYGLRPDHIPAHGHCQRCGSSGVPVVSDIDYQLSSVSPSVVGGVLRHVGEVAVLDAKQCSVVDMHVKQCGVMVHAPAVAVEHGDLKLMDRIAAAGGSRDDIARFLGQRVFLYIHLTCRHDSVQAVADTCVIF